MIVLPFGFDLYTAFVVVGIGTVLHHLADSAIAVVLYKAVSNSMSLSRRSS